MRSEKELQRDGDSHRWRGKAAEGDRETKGNKTGTSRDLERQIKRDRPTDIARDRHLGWGGGPWASPGTGSKRQKETHRGKKDIWRLKGRDLETERERDRGIDRPRWRLAGTEIQGARDGGCRVAGWEAIGEDKPREF